MVDYCIASFHKMREQDMLTIYVTDCLQAIATNTAILGGNSVPERYWYYVHPETKPKEKKLTTKSVVANIRKKLEG